MPIFDDSPRQEPFTNPDDVPRPVVTIGVTLVSKRFELDFHRHRKSQLMMSQRGVLTCEAEGGLWIVPPQCAIWIPPGVLHSIRSTGTIEGYTAFIEPAAATTLPSVCCSISVSPLLRELMVRSASFPALYPEGGLESHLATLLLDEIAVAPVNKLHVPMPTDERLRKIVQTMMADPAERGTLESWAARVGLSERTLIRLVARQTGMSFGRWRQQFHIMLALQWLATGASIQQVAAGLGYESAGGFVTMFRKALGSPPGRYMAERRPGYARRGAGA